MSRLKWGDNISISSLWKISIAPENRRRILQMVFNSFPPPVFFNMMFLRDSGFPSWRMISGTLEISTATIGSVTCENQQYKRLRSDSEVREICLPDGTWSVNADSGRRMQIKAVASIWVCIIAYVWFVGAASFICDLRNTTKYEYWGLAPLGKSKQIAGK